ncbi:ABC transporter ATP-binding protein [Aureibacter tunicatorum]|uniref:ABC-type multidrug transport system ATPase subunit n=1 Tax=Aureibacter tunicatorum TaxID=866807 RepID=A0AAE3XIK2_9BACT|nr:ABC transporter ATP-binding protein [Aureibacter tunicatorum]MDR6237467.1 ABC-type multidrug transport system ATPase subunit [Aureibacter tunicatorum]BDD06456.1 multidrug ABC transporter ATP-binding protein [Aureibacter tunicatorum]
MNSLNISNLQKTYANGVKALDNVNLQISTGMFGLLGPNGAGKSSLMRTLATLQEPDQGAVKLNEIDILKQPEELRKVLGYLPQEFGVYPRITAEQLLDHIAVLKGISNKKERKELVAYLLNKVNLYDKRKLSVKSFSGGMKQRVGIAQAIIGNPKLVIVDEPTAGLDPGERNRFHNLLADIAENSIVILSTHIVDDVHELCSNMAVMNFGKILFNGTPNEAIDMLNGQIWEKTISRHEIDDYEKNFEVISKKMVAGQTLIHVVSNTQPELGFENIKPNLEDVFFSQINSESKELV